MEQTPKKKKDRSIRPAVLFVTLFAIIVVIAVTIPLQRHQQFVNFMTDLSAMTSRAGAKEMVVCREGGEEYKISSDAAYAIYGKLVCSESTKLIKPDEALAAEGFKLSYWLLGAELTLAPATYQNEQALYVDYHSESVDYTFIAPHLDYGDVHSTVKNGRLPD